MLFKVAAYDLEIGSSSTFGVCGTAEEDRWPCCECEGRDDSVRADEVAVTAPLPPRFTIGYPKSS